MNENKISRGNIREMMFNEMSEKKIFDQVKDYAFNYFDDSLTRNVFPTQEAIDGLKEFDEELPVGPSPAEDVLKKLNKFGSPATVIENGGRFFGFVIGGTIPASLAARWLADFWDQNAGMSCSDNLKHLVKGIEKANSWSVDAHKTLNSPYDSGIVLCNDRDALFSALHVTGSYLMHSEARDGYSYTPEMSRRARIVELWAAIKYLGSEGMRDLVEGLYERTRQFESEIMEAGFHVLNDVVFNQVLVVCENDDITSRTLELIQKSGECWCGSAQWGNRKVIRVSVSSWATTEEDITRSVRAFVKAYKEVKLVTQSAG